jgi:hypothetical protein
MRASALQAGSSAGRPAWPQGRTHVIGAQSIRSFESWIRPARQQEAGAADGAVKRSNVNEPNPRHCYGPPLPLRLVLAFDILLTSRIGTPAEYQVLLVWCGGGVGPGGVGLPVSHCPARGLMRATERRNKIIKPRLRDRSRAYTPVRSAGSSNSRDRRSSRHKALKRGVDQLVTASPSPGAPRALR